MKTIVSLNNIKAGYDGKIILKDVSFDIHENDYVGIIGPNGGGKSTLLKVILGILKPTEGEVTYFKNGEQTSRISMGYLPQYNKIDKTFPISVYDTILTGVTNDRGLFGRFTTEQRQQVEAIIARMDLQGLEDRPISALSGGQLQRILLARALVSRPDILILDEPNTYIDEIYQAQMYSLLDNLNKECAVVLVSHDIETMKEKAKQIVCVNRSVRHYDTEETSQEDLKKQIEATFQQ